MQSDSPSRMTTLRPTLLVVAGLVVLAAAAGFYIRERNVAPISAGTAPVTQATTQPEQPGAPSAQKPSFDVVRINPQGEAVMAGRAAPGSKVIIADGGKQIGSVTADQNGDWVFTPGTPLPPGSRELTLSEQLPNGKEAKGDRSVVLVVPQTAVAQNAPPPMAVLTGPNAAPSVLTGPAPAAGSGSTRLGLGAMEYDEHGTVRFSGTAPPGSGVRLYVDNHPVGGTVAGKDGQWSLAARDALAPGAHSLRLDQLATNGSVAGRLERSFTREQMTAMQLPAGQIEIQPGQNLWVIARHTYGQGIRYLVIFQANRQQIRDPNLIYPGQVFAVPASDPASGGTPAMPASSSTSR